MKHQSPPIMPPPKTYSYEDYLQLMADSSGMKIQKESAQLIERFRGHQQLSARFAPVTFLLDYTTKKYIYVDQTCFGLLGYTAEYFLEKGLDEYKSRWHPADYDILNREIIPYNINFIRTLSKNRYTDFVFSYNHRIQNAIGEYITVLQRYSYIPDEKTEIPCGVIGVVFDITHFKTDLSMVQTIEETIPVNGELVNKVVYKKIHPVFETFTQQLISKRELDVLKYLADGLSSKLIADKLNISINTINNHRKNMLLKTNCKSSAELINYAAKHGLLHENN